MNQKNSLLIFALACVFLSYGYEMANYTLSIDEEVYAAGLASYTGALKEGRCGMALLIKLFPLVPGVPVVPTLLFVLGLVISGLIITSFFEDKIIEKYIFIGLFCTSPIWPHIGEFNTISWAFSIALVIASIGVYFLIKEQKHSILMSALCVAFSISVYQALLIYYIVIILMFILVFKQNNKAQFSAMKLLWRLALICLLALFIYKVMTLSCNHIYGFKNDYLDAYINLNAPKNCFLKMMQTSSMAKAGGYLLGCDPIFLVGSVWFGVLFCFSIISIILFSKFPKNLLSFIIIILATGASVLFVLISGGCIPTRALAGLPILYSFIPAIAFNKFIKWWKGVFLLLVIGVIFSSITIANLLFYTDHLSNIKDEVMGTQLIYEINKIAADHFTGNIPITIYGSWLHASTTNLKRVEIFGTSFFGFDGDAPYRMCYYLKILGCDYLDPISITQVRDYIDYISHQPTWPRAGSVFLVNNVVVVKLSEMSYPQIQKLKEN